jgi:hypothetical protein
MKPFRTSFSGAADQGPRRSLPPFGRLAAILIFALAQACALRAQDILQPGQVDQLMAPIALYPDPLIALILPSSADPSDLVSAAGYLQQNGDPAQVDSQPWDDSVRALAHYPEVVAWLAQNLDWTQAVGSAFLAQPGDVMLSIQRLRAEARASGALVNSPEQIAILDADGNIEIEPAEGDVMYVPRYDPGVVYAGGMYDFSAGPCITYGDPYPVGIWLTFGFDWRNHAIWVGDWSTWHGADGWRHPVFRSPGPGGPRRWSPPPDRPRPVLTSRGPGAFVPAQPKPMRGAPQTPPGTAVRFPHIENARAGYVAPTASGDGRGQAAPPAGSGRDTAAPGTPRVAPSGDAKGGKAPASGGNKGATPPAKGGNPEAPPDRDRKGDTNH